MKKKQQIERIERLEKAFKEIKRLKKALVDMEVRARRAEDSCSTDALTGILNPRGLAEGAQMQISHARRHGEPVAFLFIDLNFFKEANDKFGHSAGDSLLVQVARFLRNWVRESDLVGRIGGDEFAIVLPRGDRAHAGQVARKIKGAIKRKIFGISGAKKRHWIRTTVSIGTSSTSEEGVETYESLKEIADKRMYRNKREGRKRKVR